MQNVGTADRAISIVIGVAITFRAVARASKLEWTRVGCFVQGTLDRVAGATQFTRFVTRARLTVPQGAIGESYLKALEKAERGCLVANSLRAERELQIQIDRGDARSSQAVEA